MRGVCYGTSPDPNLSGKFTINGTGAGIFISNLTGLAFGKTYYVRAFATNNFGNVDAWLLDFISGTIYYSLKFSLFRVRAIRAF
jgi:predicted GNAT superfamily acetyltransferase